jgi:hypothetical protein
MGYDWAEYKRVERGHAKGEHSRCDPAGKCKVAQQLWSDNEGRLEAIAMLAVIAELGIDPAALGDFYDELVASAALDIPDFDYLEDEPNEVHRLMARSNLKLMGLLR